MPLRRGSCSYGRAVAKIVCPSSGGRHFSAIRSVSLSSLKGEAVAQFDSDYSGGEGASLLFQFRYVNLLLTGPERKGAQDTANLLR